MRKFQRPKFLVARLALALGVAGTAAPWAAAQSPSPECAPLWAKLEANLQVRDLKAAAEATKLVKGTSDCGGLRVKAGQLMYGAYREEAARLEREKAPAAVQLAALQAAIGYGKLPLDLQAKVGDLKAELRDFSGASQAYDQVVSLANKLPERDRPTPNAIKRYDGLAFQYEQLADKPVPRQAGLRNYLQTDRSVQIAPASVSVQFHFDSDEMTGGGELQAESLFKLLNEQRMPKIHLVGHTDPKGTHEYNDALSIRRAKALKVFLVKKGYRDSDITIDGRGKREADTFQVYDRDKFSKDQIHQILRRVALDSRHK